MGSEKEEFVYHGNIEPGRQAWTAKCRRAHWYKRGAAPVLNSGSLSKIIKHE